jgi:hypothetical protein
VVGGQARLVVDTPSGPDVFDLGPDRIVVGRSREADVVIEHDPTVSRRHVEIESRGSAWSLRHVSTMNPTTVNGKPLVDVSWLRDKDEIIIGRTRMVFRCDDTEPEDTTETLTRPPDVTKREKDVLRELCRPLFENTGPFTQPATREEIAERLFIVPGAVQQHLGRLYDKLGIEGSDRRVRLAKLAIQSSVITRHDYDDLGS